MNSKNSLLLVLAVLFVVSQLMSDDSTISSLASADPDEVQMTMENGEKAISSVVQGAPQPPSDAPVQRVSSATLDDFYGTDAEEEVEPSIEPEVTDVDPYEPEQSSAAANDVSSEENVSSSSVEYINSQPFGPRVQ